MRHLDDGQIAELIDTADRRSGRPADVEAHLTECAACRERVEEARTIAERARTILATAVPAVSTAAPIPSFDQVLHRAGRMRRRASGIRIRSLAWAATVVIAGGLGWYARGELLDTGRRDAPAVEFQAQPYAAAPAEPTLADSHSTPSGRVAETRAPAPAPAAAGARNDPPLANLQRQAEADQVVTDRVATPPALPPARSDEAGRLAIRQLAPAPAEQAPTVGVVEERLLSRRFADPNRTVVSGDVVERVLGGRPASVEGLSVDAFYQLAAEPDVIYSEQRLPGGKVLEMAQQRAGVPPALQMAAAARRAEAARQPEPAAEMEAKTAVVESVDTLEVGGLRIVVRALIPPDSLRALVRRIRR
jgi:hypothetical protein